MEHDVLVDIQHVFHRFPLAKGLALRTLEDVSLSIHKGEILGLVGESGAGKSTLARCVMNILKPDSGRIFYDGIDTCDPKQYRAGRKRLKTQRQMIFQDSASSLNPRMKIADIITEPLRISRQKPKRGSMREEARYQMERVGLEACFLDRRPPELSGGQRQRAAIARALSMEPELLVADEPVASLDVSIQAQVINLFLELQKENGFTLLLISHDLSMVEFLCSRVGVLCHGRLVELASVAELYENPVHGYTKALLSAIPLPDPRRERARKLMEFDTSEWERGRLMSAGERKKTEPGEEGRRMKEVSPGHLVAWET